MSDDVMAQIRAHQKQGFGNVVGIEYVEVGPDRVVGIELGPSPITEDRYVPPERVRDILSAGRG